MAVIDSTPSAAEENLTLVRRFFDCFARGHLDTLRDEILAPDVVWHVPGSHLLAGTYRGPEEVAGFFERMAAAKFQVDILFLQADEDRVVDVHRGWSGRGGDNDIDMTWVLVYRIENRRIIEARSFVADQATADAFFRKAYPSEPSR